MAHTSAVPHPPRNVMRQGTARACSHKTVLLHVPSIFASCIFCPVGRDPQPTLRFFTTPATLIFTSQRGSIILRMLGLPRQTRCSSLIEACGTTWLNGVAAIKRKLSFFI